MLGRNLYFQLTTLALAGFLAACSGGNDAEKSTTAPAPVKSSTTTVIDAPPAATPEPLAQTGVPNPAEAEALAALTELGADEATARTALLLNAKPHGGGVPPDAEVGDVFYYLTTGSAEGTVWGTDVYTHDSAIEIAAVHAGALKAGETGIVRVEVVAGLQSYEGAVYNGVTSEGYGEYHPAYTITAKPENAAEETAALAKARAEFETAQNAARPALNKKAAELSAKPFSGLPARENLEPGQTLHFIMTGTTRASSIWGSNPYTFDSDLSGAAVHAGILKPRERGIVKMEVIEKLESYEGSEANGLRSAPYGEYGPAVKLSRVELE